MKDRLRLDLIFVGFGNVGRRFASLLEERRARLVREEGLAFRILGAVTRRHGSVFNPEGIAASRLCEDAAAGRSLDSLGIAPPPGWQPPASSVEFVEQAVRAAVAADPSRHLVVVESSVLDIARGEPATGHIRAALRAGAHVISANKGPVAFAYAELDALAREANRCFFFEGAVMDGVPIFNLVRETLPACSVVGFRGVVNSTTNFILSEMEAGKEFGAALAEMQAAGIAEADASLDVDGWDAAAKTAALVNVLMKGSITPHDVDRTGIGHLTGDQVRATLAGGSRWKLISSAGYRDGRLVAKVAAEPVASGQLLARLDGMQNALVLQTDLLGEIAVVQLDSGLTQTAYALLSDLVAVRRRV